MKYEEELNELDSVQKDLYALCSVEQMTASYPAWRRDADTMMVATCALGSIIKI